jgi:aryl-alcohol dehydrogenase-like predicted oxidoreductase
MKDRRSFLKSMAAATAGILVPIRNIHGIEFVSSDRIGNLLPLRTLGATNEKVTMLGIGGSHVSRMDESTSEKVIEAAIEGGIRFFDNAESYGNGLAEERYGKFLTPKYRDVSFIMSKTRARDGKTAQEHLEGSLRRMKTDYIDLWQIHHLSSVEDVDGRVAEGVLDVVIKAKESGKVRNIGLTGHADYKALQRMLGKTDVLQTCQMPINCFDPNYKSYINNVMPTLVERNMGIIAMKTLSNGGFFGGRNHFEPGDEKKIIPRVLSIKEALTFVWSLPVSVLVTGADNVEMLNEKIAIAKSFKTMTEEDRTELVTRLGGAGFEGEKVEFYKR